MIKLLYVNHGHDERCGVHDLGRRHAAMLEGDDIAVTYVECNSLAEYRAARQWFHPDVAIINYMPGIMPWVSRDVVHPSCEVLAVIHNYGPDTVGQVVKQHLKIFTGCIALDPAVTAGPGLIVTDRPIPATVDVELDPGASLQVGSFGFAFPHKGFADVAEEIASTGQPATYNLHMPEAFFNGANGEQLYTDGIIADIEARLRHDQQLVHTAEHLPADELVARLARNHVNCLFYVPGQHNAGISSALDYLIAARRPILVTDCTMFGHARDYVSLYPGVRLGDIIDSWDEQQAAAGDFYRLATGKIRRQTRAALASFL